MMAEEIAAGLPPAHRFVIGKMRKGVWIKGTGFVNKGVMRDLEDAGVCDGQNGQVGRLRRLTPLGLAVRDILARQSDSGRASE